MGSNHEKNRGRKSRDKLPLICTIEKLFLIIAIMFMCVCVCVGVCVSVCVCVNAVYAWSGVTTRSPWCTSAASSPAPSTTPATRTSTQATGHQAKSSA